MNPFTPHYELHDKRFYQTYTKVLPQSEPLVYSDRVIQAPILIHRDPNASFQYHPRSNSGVKMKGKSFFEESILYERANTQPSSFQYVVNREFPSFQLETSYSNLQKERNLEDSPLFNSILTKIANKPTSLHQEKTKRVLNSTMASKASKAENSHSYQNRLNSYYLENRQRFYSEKGPISYLETLKDIKTKKSFNSYSSSNKQNYLSTPSLPFVELSRSNTLHTGTRSTKSASNQFSTHSRTPKGNTSQEYIVTITENRANEIGFAFFNVFTGEVTISQVNELLIRKY